MLTWPCCILQLKNTLVSNNVKFWPKDLRVKKTRAIRRRLTSKQVCKHLAALSPAHAP